MLGAAANSSSSWRKYDLSAIANGPLYYYVGAGLSMASGLVGWSEMASLVWQYRKSYEDKRRPGTPPGDIAEQNERYLDSFVTQRASQGSRVKLLSRKSEMLITEGRALGRAALLNMLLRYRSPLVRLVPGYKKVDARPEAKPRLRPGEEPTAEDLAVQSLLWESGCHGILTSNYDLLLEHAFSLFKYGVALRSYRYTADLLRYVLSNRRFVLHLHGDINDIATMLFRPSGAWAKWCPKGLGLPMVPGSTGDDLKRVYANILNRGHVIYLGCGFRDDTIRQLHNGWDSQVTTPGTTRLALVLKSEIEERDVRPDFPKIKFLTWEDPKEVREFVERVVLIRKEAGWREHPSLEATDLHRQLFLSRSPATLRRNLRTEPWTCKALKPS